MTREELLRRLPSYCEADAKGIEPWLDAHPAPMGQEGHEIWTGRVEDLGWEWDHYGPCGYYGVAYPNGSPLSPEDAAEFV